MFPFFTERRHGVLLILRAAAGGKEFRLQSRCGVNVHLQAHVDRFLALTNRDRCIAGDTLGELHGFRHELIRRVNRIDEADAERFLRLDIAAGIDQFFCLSHADRADKALGSAKAGRDAEARFGLAEQCVFRSDADIAAQGQLAAAAEREAVDRRDDGHRQLLNLAEYRVALRAERAAFVGCHGAHGADIGTGDERFRARAGNDEAACFVGVNGVDDSFKVAEDFVVQCIEGLLPVDGDDADETVLLISDIAHLSSSLPSNPGKIIRISSRWWQRPCRRRHTEWRGRTRCSFSAFRTAGW